MRLLVPSMLYQTVLASLSVNFWSVHQTWLYSLVAALLLHRQLESMVEGVGLTLVSRQPYHALMHQVADASTRPQPQPVTRSQPHAICCRSAWAYTAAGPLFSTPAVDTHTSTILVAAVTGSVTALSHLGQPLWHRNLGSQIFAPLCYLAASWSPAAHVQQLPAGASAHAVGVAPDHSFQTGTTNAEAAAAGITAATCKDRHNLNSGDPTCGCGVSADDDGARGFKGGGAVVLVGTSGGILHCVSCASGRLLWKVQNGGSISTAAAFCPASRPSAPAPAGALVAGNTLAELLSQTSAATHEQTQSHTCTDADCSVQHQNPSSQQTQMSFECPLVSCTNHGTVRVLSLQDFTCKIRGLMQPGQPAASCAEVEGRQQNMPSTHAAAQMPGDCPL